MILSWKLFESMADKLDDCKDILLDLELEDSTFKTQFRIVNYNSREGVPTWKTMYWRNKGITNDFLIIDIKKTKQVADSTFRITDFHWGEIKDVVFRIADCLGVDYSNVELDENTTLKSAENWKDDSMFQIFNMQIKL